MDDTYTEPVSIADAPAPDEASNEVRRILGVRRHDLHQFILYGLNGVFTAIMYSIAFWSLLALSRHTFVLDVIIAYAVAGLCNYTGARRLFKPTTKLHGHVRRYLVVLVGAFSLTSALAWSLDQAGAPRFVGAYLPVVVTSLPVFLLMRAWVFSPATSGD